MSQRSTQNSAGAASAAAASRRRGWIGRRLARYLANRQGVASIEFAMVLPVMALALFGCVVVFDSVRAARRMDDGAAIVADLVSRKSSMNDVSRDAMFETARALVLEHLHSSDFDITISSVVTRLNASGGGGGGGGAGSTTIAWTETTKQQGLVDLDTVSLPTVPVGESVVVVQLEGRYAPVINVLENFDFEMSKIAIRRPRFVTEVVYE